MNRRKTNGENNIKNQLYVPNIIIHIALFRWKEGTTPETIEKTLQQVKNLKPKCHGITNIFCGESYHQESKGFTHGIVIIAKDQEALDDYRKHPDHKMIANDIGAIEEDGLGFDFKDLR